MNLTLAEALRSKGDVDSIDIPFVRYRIRVRVTEPISLPEYAGSALRGAFGRALRRTSCMLHRKDCKSCPLYRSCPYTMVFETPPPKQHSLQRFSQVPNAYVIEPPAWGRKVYETGEELSFNIVLCGRAIDYLSLVVYSLERAFDFNVGQGKAELQEVCIDDGDSQHRIYAAECDQVMPHKTSALVHIPQTDAFSMRLETPTRIQNDGVVMTPELFCVESMAMAVVRRVALLYEFHCSDTLKLDFQGLAESAKDIQAQTNLHWADWVRYSSRQQQRMHLGGVVGSIELTHVAKELRLFLAIAQYTHIGKNATFGLGKLILSK